MEQDHESWCMDFQACDWVILARSQASLDSESGEMPLPDWGRGDLQVNEQSNANRDRKNLWLFCKVPQALPSAIFILPKPSKGNHFVRGSSTKKGAKIKSGTNYIFWSPFTSTPDEFCLCHFAKLSEEASKNKEHAGRERLCLGPICLETEWCRVGNRAGGVAFPEEWAARWVEKEHNWSR